MIGAGISLGVMVDTYTRLFWRGKSQLLRAIQDILFWVLCSLLIFGWLYLVNHGEMRIVILLALLCGYSAYQALLQRGYQRLLEGVIRVVLTIYRWLSYLIYQLIFKPFYWLFTSIVGLFVFKIKMLLHILRILSSLASKLKRGFFPFVAKWFRNNKEK